jgi:hypothetical protein
MCNRISVLFLKIEDQDLNITDEEIEAAQCEDSNPELYRISRNVGELFEEFEFEIDQID